MPDGLQDLGNWLNGVPAHFWARDLLRGVRWLNPTLQSIHIVGIAVVIGSAGMLDLRLLGWAVPSQAPAEMARRLMPWLWSALVVQLATGGMLLLNRPLRYFENGSFLLKMVLLALALVLTMVLARGLFRRDDFWSDGQGRLLAGRLIAGLSLLAWLAVTVAGRWIAYV